MMRLLQLGSRGELRFTKEFHDDVPAYAILSHTWGDDQEEVTFHDIETASGTSKAGYAKLLFCGQQAKADGLEYFWVDTCCINKANNTELSEAITSMFRWYQRAQHCYVYLTDVSVVKASKDQPQVWEPAFRNSRWFTRGWTLQELIAPRSVKFFSREEEFLGDKKTLGLQIQVITGVPISVLSGSPLTQYSTEERLRWAETRNTKRKEDKAYCLMGIFDIFMPLIYGEGDYAFIRLLHEIDRRSGKKDIKRTVDKNAYWIVTHKPNPLFIGREGLLQDLEDILYDAIKNPSYQTQCRIVISGIGGQGKSEICVQLARRLRLMFWAVLWVDVSTTSTAERSFLYIAEQLHIPAQTLEDVRLGIANLKKTWLLVLDNADDPGVDYQHYFPDGTLGAVLMTSRNPECQQYATMKSVSLEGLSSKSAEELLLRAACVPQDQYSVQAEDAATVANLLRSHPLALIQAGAYVSHGHCTLSQYPRLFQQHRERLLASNSAQGQSRYRDVYATADLLRSAVTEFATDTLSDGKSNFFDSAYGTQSHGRSSEAKVMVPARTDMREEEVDDTSTEYSDVSMADSQMDTYMDRLVDDLYAIAISLDSDSECNRSLCKNLPEILQQFALRISHEVPSMEGREVMYYVHQRRRRVAELVGQRLNYDGEVEEDSASTASAPVPFQEKVRDWMEQQDPDVDMLEDAPFDPDFSDDPESNVERYVSLVSRTSAYHWLKASVGRELTQTSKDDGLLTNLHEGIQGFLPPLPKISLRKQPERVTLLFKVNWDPVAFIHEQQYSGDSALALETAIVLTGLPTDAQALPCFQYLKQAWPSSSNCIINLICKLVRNDIDQKVQATSSDGGVLIAWRYPPFVYVEASGSRSSIREVGEQLAWLGAALSCSPYDHLANCWPYVDDRDCKSEVRSEDKHSTSPGELKALTIKFTFDQDGLGDETLNGDCWQNLFRNPVLVRGFPIMRRKNLQHGLEMPLNMMAGLVGAVRAHKFDSAVVIKGFSAMLVATSQVDDLLMWHVLFDPDGGHISYLGHNLVTVQGLALSRLQKLRHVVGWCSHAANWAGRPEANYKIERSRLPTLGAGCILENISISAGKFVTAGFGFGIGIKDVPVHVSRKPYVQKLRWVASKFFVFWDTEEQRGWLVKGTSALLHLVRASLEYYQADSFNVAVLSKPSDILAPVESQGDYAIQVLLNEHNRDLPIYIEKDEQQTGAEYSLGEVGHSATQRKKTYYKLENRVEELYEMLEKIIEHQIDVCGQAGLKLKAHARRRLEGWDFKDLASDRDPFYPRSATLHAYGKGWVDFIRSTQAVTLLGRGFGELIGSSKKIICSKWAEVPKYRYHLAALVSDLQQIMELDGDERAKPMQLCNGILWYSSSTVFGVCRCADTRGNVHSDFVQMLWPTSLRAILPKQISSPLQNEGAVIFGHNSAFAWTWPDKGDPIPVDPTLELSVTNGEDFYDSGIGSTETAGSRRSGLTLPISGNYETVSSRRLPISVSGSAEPEASLVEPEGYGATSAITPGKSDMAKIFSRPTKRGLVKKVRKYFFRSFSRARRS